LTAGLIATCAGGWAASAQAAPITECGNMYIDGVRNITTRHVTCHDARSFAHKYTFTNHYYSGWVRLKGWHVYLVRFRYQGHLRDDIRATRPGTDHVIHFQIGPYGVSDGGRGKCAGIPAGQPCY
jgi:hypothetical protein